MIDNKEKNLYSNDAQFYDLDTRGVMKVDILFYKDLASKNKGDILELACGTGRITIPLAEAGYNIWGLEYSEAMLRQFNNKVKELPGEVASKIHLLHGDMSKLSLGRKFPLILLPCRSFQLLLDEELENACLKSIHDHLTDDGTFVIDIGNFIGNKENVDSWVSDEETFDWKNTDPQTGITVHRTHIKKEINTVKQVIYPQKTYRVTKRDGSIETIVKRSPWKYFFQDQIRELIISNGFEIVKEMGTYDGQPISDNHPEFIFICRRNA